MFKRLVLIAVLCLLGLASPLIVLPFAGAMSPLGLRALWVIDLGTHWQLLYVAMLAIAVIAIAFIKRSPRWLLLLVFCGLPFVTAAPRADKTEDVPGGPHQGTLTIASANVYFENEDSKPLVAWITARKADVVVVSEVSHAFSAQLGKLSEFPHRKIITRDDPFGLAILSRHPFDSVEEFKTEEGIPYIRAVVKWKDRPIAITAVHPLPPVTMSFMVERDQLLLAEARHLKERSMPALMVGDMNATAWSVGLAGPTSMGLLRTTPLNRPTWPTVMLGAMGIPIDHILASAHWRVVSSEVGPDVGSDHFPVAAVLQLR